MLSSTTSGMRATAATVSKVRPWPACTSRPAAAAACAARSSRVELALQARRRRPRARARNRRRCAARRPAAPIRAAASMASGSGSMNSDTRMPAAFSGSTTWRRWFSPPRHVEAAFGGALLALLGHEAAGVRHMPQRDGEHLVGGGHLEVEGPGQLALETGDVVVGDVAAILAQVRGDAVGAGLDGKVGGAQRIGMPAAARVADGGDVVDVDAQAQARGVAGGLSGHRHGKCSRCVCRLDRA